jgi:hypothetical protein
MPDQEGELEIQESNRTDQKINPFERRWAFIFGLAVMLVSSLPYLVGYLSQGVDWRFTGGVLGIEDINSYLANMVTGSAGAWLFRTPFTAYPQRGTLIFLQYILLGKLAGGPELHDQIILLFHLFRVVAGLLAVLATYDFLAIFIKQVRWRRWGTILAVLGGGLGWLITISGHAQWLGSLPVEFYSPEAFGFIMYYSLPHLVLARALLLWGLRGYLLADRATGKRFILSSLGVGVIWLLTSLAQPLTGMVVGAVPAAHLAVTAIWQFLRQQQGKTTDWQTWRHYFTRALLAGLVAGPFVVYNALVFMLDPLLKSWSTQSGINAPHPLLYLLAYGLVLPLSIVGAVRLFKLHSWHAWFLSQWVIVFMLAIYIPFSLQRRLNEGVWVALIALAGAAFERVSWLNRPTWWLRRLPAGILGISLVATLLLFMGGFILAAQPAKFVFIPADEARVFNDLAQRTAPGEVVLCAYHTGNALPAWAPLRVVIGITTLSANFDVLQPAITTFFQKDTSDGQRRAFLDELHVQYVFWGPEERLLGNWNPSQAAYLTPFISEGEYAVFAVK